MFWQTDQYQAVPVRGRHGAAGAAHRVGHRGHRPPGFPAPVDPRMGAPPVGRGALLRHLPLALPGHRPDHPAQRRRPVSCGPASRPPSPSGWPRCPGTSSKTPSATAPSAAPVGARRASAGASGRGPGSDRSAGRWSARWRPTPWSVRLGLVRRGRGVGRRPGHPGDQHPARRHPSPGTTRPPCRPRRAAPPRRPSRRPGRGSPPSGTRSWSTPPPTSETLLPGITIDAQVGQQLYQVQARRGPAEGRGRVGNRLILELGHQRSLHGRPARDLLNSLGPMQKIVLVNTARAPAVAAAGQPRPSPPWPRPTRTRSWSTGTPTAPLLAVPLSRRSPPRPQRGQVLRLPPGPGPRGAGALPAPSPGNGPSRVAAG